MILTITEIDAIIKYVAGVHNMKYREDLKQECYLFALEAEAYFDGTPEQFKRYLGKSLKGICKNYLNEDRGGNRIIDNDKSLDIDETVSFDDDDGITLSETITNGDSLENYLEAADYIEYLKKTRSDRDVEIFRLYTEGWTGREIASEFPELGLRGHVQIHEIINSFKNNDSI